MYEVFLHLVDDFADGFESLSNILLMAHFSIAESECSHANAGSINE
jgi:hypothetical protein